MLDDAPLTIVVDDDAADQRLDQFLAGPLGSRARAARMIAAGLVRVDGRRVLKRHAVAVRSAGRCRRRGGWRCA